MKKIKLTQGKFALVDDQDFEYLNQWKWHYSTGYAKKAQWDKGLKKSRIIRMHHFIIPFSKGYMIDHKNGNGIDNRRKNLRLVTKSQNMMNRKIQRNNSSGYKGVAFHKKTGKWRVYININRKQIHLGLFEDKKIAAQEWNKAALKYHGEFALLNQIL